MSKYTLPKWRGKKYHDPKSGKSYKMVGPFTYMRGKDKRFVRFIPAARTFAKELSEEGKSNSEICSLIGCSLPTLRLWLDQSSSQKAAAKKTKTRTKKTNKGRKITKAFVESKLESAQATKVRSVDVRQAFLACEMHKNGFPHGAIRNKLKINNDTLTRWINDFGYGADTLQPTTQVKIMLANGNAKDIAEQFKVPVGMVEMLKREAKFYYENI